MARKGSAANGSSRGHYVLRVLSRGRKPFGLELLEAGDTEQSEGLEHVARIWGDPLDGILDAVLGAVRRSGHRPSDLGPNRKKPFPLAEEEGVRLGLLFTALKPLRKASRIEAVAERVGRMEAEEMYYWFSKVTAERDGRRAARALRILLSEE